MMQQLDWFDMKNGCCHIEMRIMAVVMSLVGCQIAEKPLKVYIW